ncbi:c-type cytochrome [Vibrio methylphosphonaticus]|uniref:c-type cytochrome n=1 Tax=Vibrio methylphosphonaticus TaxID=2946866 RepID=UPI002029B544|nr:cytochrome c [Vibrio methylphosphonaticus]MCL9775635.1 cytochrome c [Vibrio methylphosphonaticus]
MGTNWVTKKIGDKLLLVSSAILVLAPSISNADEKFALGEQKAKVCVACHGVDGISSIESYPNLRGQKMAYLITSLKSYQSRERSAGLAVLMQQQADALSDKDMSDIAYYYSKLGSSSDIAGNAGNAGNAVKASDSGTDENLPVSGTAE